MKQKIFALILPLFIASSLFGAEITIPKLIKTSKEKIILGDIAQLKGCDPAWKSILLAYIIKPGSSVELPLDYIKARLKLKGVPVEKIKLNIPEIVKIKREAIRISKNDLIAIARHCIQKNNPWGRRLRIVDIKAKDELLLPKGTLTYSCQLFGSALGSFSVPIVFKVNGEVAARTWVMAKTRLIIPIVISACPIRRGETITRDKIKVIKKDVSRLPAGIFTKPDDLLGKRARVNIGMNRIIYKSMVEIPPLIKRGQRVTIVAESCSLKVTAPGRAKEDGRLGDIIRVENLISKKTIMGKVVDSQTVKVEF